MKTAQKPSRGTLIAAKARAACNKHSKEQRADYIARAMAHIYGNASAASK